MVEALLNCFNDLKSSYQLKGLDFEKRRMMAERFENSGFGPASDPDIADELSPNEKKTKRLGT